MTGKWHAMGKNIKEIFDQTGSKQPGQLKTYNSPAGHITDITANEAVNLIKNYNNEKPFFADVSFNAPHVQTKTTKNHYDLYPGKNIILPTSALDNGAVFQPLLYAIMQKFNRKNRNIIYK